MEIIGLIGILIGLVVLFILALRGYSLLITGPISAAIIIIFNSMGFAGLSSIYLGGMGAFVANVFLFSLLGAAIGKYYEDSGAAVTVAQNMMKLVGADKSGSPMRIVITLTTISAILTYGGVSVFAAIFALIPIAKEMFKRANLPWHLSLIPICLGMATFTTSTLPGNPSMGNILPTQYLGTKLTALPVVGIVTSVVVIAVGLLYARAEIKKAQAKGECYEGADKAIGGQKVEEENRPGITASYLPMVALILIVFIGSVLNINNIVYMALITAIVLEVILFWKYIPDQKKTLTSTAANAMGPTLNTAAVVGVGSVVAAAPSFSLVASALATIPGGPVINLTAIGAIMAAITGSPTGAIGIVMQNFAQNYIDAGVNPDVIHRIASIVTTGFSAMPHCGGAVALLACAGLTHNQGYKHIFMTSFVAHFIALVVALIMVMI